MQIVTPPRVSRRTAQRDLVRGMKFLSTLSRVPEIRASLEEGAGYTEVHHREGWQLLLTAMGYVRTGAQSDASPLPQQAAVAQLDAWDGLNFERARATLRFEFPDQSEYLFRGLNAAAGASAIGSVQTFVDRVIALRDGTDETRTVTRDRDQAAAQRLAERKIFDSEVQAKLEGLLGQAKQLAALPKDPDIERQIQEAADALHVWLSDWTGQARAFITRGDYLIRLGLSSRKSRGSVDDDTQIDDDDVDEADVGDEDVGDEDVDAGAATNADQDDTAA